LEAGPDQCTEVPTVDNGGESGDEKTTTLHIDPRAVWSDGVPITAADFLFAQRLFADPNILGGPPWNQMSLTALDPRTVQIRWDVPYADYLTALLAIPPVPLHVYATGKLAHVYEPAAGAYDSTLAQQVVNDATFTTAIPVDNGPFTVQSFTSNTQVALVRNPRFFSNFFHAPALDRVTLVSAAQDFLGPLAQGLNPAPEEQADLVGRYRQGGLDLALGLEPLNLSQMGGIPKNEVIASSLPNFAQLGFNERSTAPNAQANGGTSIFTDRTVRQAFVEALDRCTAVRALLGMVTCGDPNLFSDEPEVTAADATYDPTFKLPAYNPADAARLLGRAGYPLVDGIRRSKDGTTPLQLQLFVSPGASADAGLAQHIQQDYTRSLHVGVTIVNDIRLWTPQRNPIKSGTFDLLLSDGQTSADPVGRLTFNLGPFDSADVISPQNPGGWNPYGIINPQANQRDQLAAQTLSDDQRIAVIRSLERSLAEQYYVEELYIRADITLSKPTLCNFKHWPENAADLWNIADWYVAPSCPS
jgi:ABC-type transport system substrate-binding protein